MKKEHSRRKKAQPKQDKTWVIISFILAIALIASVYTDGFKFGDNIGMCIADVEEAITMTEDVELQNSLQGIADELKSAQTMLNSEAEEQVPPIEDKAEEQTASSTDSVTLEMYVMSQCPYGTQVMDGIAPVKEKLGDALDLNIDYILYPESQYAGRESQMCVDGLCSMHGTSEVKGNIVQLCAAKYNPDKYLDMIVCMDKNAGQIPDNWEDCARDNSLSVQEIKTCYEGEEGKELLRESAAKATERGATGSPTIYLAGEKYAAGRTPDDFLREICNRFEGDRPEACADVPEPVELEVIVLNDKECSSCDTGNIMSITRQLFPGAEFREVDVSSAEGKQLVEEMDLVFAPAYIFSKDVEETATWKQRGESLQRAFQKTGDRYRLLDSQTGASHYIDEEKQKEAQEKMGITTGDNRPQIDFFVMSYCPYGNIAEEAIYEVYKNLGDTVEFKPHYVLYSNYQGGGPNYCLDEDSQYCSMHGITELNQNIREECVRQLYGIEDWFKFTEAMNEECNSQNADTCWVDVAAGLGYDTDQIDDCEENKGLEIAANDKELGELFGARGSPAVYIDGTEFSGERSAAGYQRALCDAFDEPPAECGNTISSDTGSAPAGSCG